MSNSNNQKNQLSCQSMLYFGLFIFLILYISARYEDCNKPQNVRDAEETVREYELQNYDNQ